MKFLDWFRSARPADEREVREEIAFHIDRATQENLANGMAPEEARAEALRRFGDMERVRRDCLAVRGRAFPPVVAWFAVAALAAASFVGGYAVRDGKEPPPPAEPPPLTIAWPMVRPIGGRLIEVHPSLLEALFAQRGTTTRTKPLFLFQAPRQYRVLEGSRGKLVDFQPLFQFPAPLPVPAPEQPKEEPK